MKISKTAVLAMWCVFTAAGLWLTVATAVADNESKTLNVDLRNAVQHIKEVVFISSWSSNSPEAIAQQVGDRLVWIETNRFVLSINENSNTITPKGNWKGNGSSILWWISNKMDGWAYNVILAWSGNEMNLWTNNTILWWEGNKTSSMNWSTIIWWKDNTIEWNHSVTVWWHDNSIKGNKSTIVGNNSSVTWNDSTALWLNSKINASGSFLWTDGWWHGELEADEVFAVMSRSGMVINTKKAHPLAQLTIWNPMIVYESRKSEGIKCEDNQWWWIMKVVKNGGNANQVCFCSCDGSGWNSLFGWRWACQSYCQWTTHKVPECGSEVKKIKENGKLLYTWSCKVWEVLEWTGAYLVTSDGKIHWSCQTEDGSASSCSGFTDWTITTYSQNIGFCDLTNKSCADSTNSTKSREEALKTADNEESWYRRECQYKDENNNIEVQRCFVCNDGFHREWNECVKDEHNTPGVCMWGDEPGTENIRKWLEEPSDNKQWEYISNINAELGACEWTCLNDNYERVAGQNYCQLKQTINNDPECNSKYNWKNKYTPDSNSWLNGNMEDLCTIWTDTNFKSFWTPRHFTWNCTTWWESVSCSANQRWCGDGDRNGDEECDLWNNNGSNSSCTTSCKSAAWCGPAAWTTQYFSSKQNTSWIQSNNYCTGNYRLYGTPTIAWSGLTWQCINYSTGKPSGQAKDCKAYQQRCGDGITNGDDEDCDDWTNNWKIWFCPSTCKRFNCITPRNFNQNLYPPYDIPFTFVNRGSIQSDTYVSVCAGRASAQNQNCSYICTDSNLIPIVGSKEVRSGCKTLKSTDINVRCGTPYSCTKAECGALHMQTITEIPWNAEYCRDSSSHTSASPTGTGWTWTCKCSSTNTTATCWANKWNINPCEGKTYTISYNCIGWSGNPQSQTITYGAWWKITNSKCTKNGDTFIWWASTSSATRPEWYPWQDMDWELITSCNDKTLYAVYASSSDFRCGNATQVSHTSQPTTDLCYGGLSTTGAYKGSDNLWHWNCKLIVSWIERINIPCKDQPSNQCKRKVTFDWNGWTANPTSKDVSCWNQTTLANASRADYTFDGWYTSKTWWTKVWNALDSYTPNGDVTLYAHWTQKSCSATTHTYGNCSYEIPALSNWWSQTVTNNINISTYTGSTTATCTNWNLSYSDETCRAIENGQCENSEPYWCKNSKVEKEDTTSDSSWKWYCKWLDGRSPLCTKSCPSGYELIWNGTHNGFCAQKVTSPSCPSNKWKLNWNNIEGCGNTPWWNNDPEAWRYTSNFTNYNTCMDAWGLYGNNSRAYIINAYWGRIPCYSCDCVKDSSAWWFTQLDQDQSSCKLNEAENCRTLYAYLDLTEYKEDACKNDETHWICRQSNNSWITCTNSSSAQQKIPCLVWK